MATIKKKQRGLTICLWYETNNIEEAVKFYSSVFKNTKVGKTTYYGDNAPMPKGTVLTIPFEINGQSFLALNGGPYAKFNESISFFVKCKTQKEIDYYWEKLSKGGTKIYCGWLKDKFGVTWQVVPEKFDEWMTTKDTSKIDRMMQAVMKMKKLNMKAMQKAYDGK